MKSLHIYFWSLIFTAMLLSISACNTVPVLARIRTYECERVSSAIKLDGDLDDAAWQKANKLWRFIRYTNSDANIENACSKTDVMMLWDDNFLYIGATLADKDLYTPVRKRDLATWKGDVLEIFLKPCKTKPAYYELHVTPNNNIFDAAIPRRGCGQLSRFLSFDANMQTAVKLAGTLNNLHDVDKYWTLEMKIPFTAFKETEGKAPQVNAEWLFNIGRYNFSRYLPERFCKGLELSCSARVSQDSNFHSYEYYDIIKFK